MGCIFTKWDFDESEPDNTTLTLDATTHVPIKEKTTHVPIKEKTHIEAVRYKKAGHCEVLENMNISENQNVQEDLANAKIKENCEEV